MQMTRLYELEYRQAEKGARDKTRHAKERVLRHHMPPQEWITV
jgi:hypothetical protein